MLRSQRYLCASSGAASVHAPNLLRLVVSLVAISWCGSTIGAESAGSGHDWPTFAHDQRRSAATSMPLQLPLMRAWVHTSVAQPTPAWPPPAKNDYWHRKHGLNPRVTFDHAYHVVAADGRIFYGSSGSDQVVCLDAATGDLRWSFFAEGPIRLAPTLHEESVVVGSDDGYLYCLATVSGKLKWKVRPGPSDARCLGNGRVISRWPIRSGAIVQDGIAYCAAGIFPTSEGVFLAGYRMNDGEQVMHQSIDQSVQGYAAGSGEKIYLPSGRTSPGIFDRHGGQRLGTLPSAGGAFAFVADDLVAAGPGDDDGQLSLTQPGAEQSFVAFQGLHLITQENRLIVHTRDHLAALDRTEFLTLAARQNRLKGTLKKLEKQKASQEELQRVKLQLTEITKSMQDCQLWKASCDCAESLILAGDMLIAGGQDCVSAYDVRNGQPQWTATVAGRACGLAAAEGRLLVSTDQGKIYCFQPGDKVPAEALSASSAETEQNTQRQAGHSPSSSVASLLQTTRADQGYALLIDPSDVRLACDLANQTRLRIVICHRDPAAVDAMRRQLLDLEIYGNRVVVHHADDSSTLASYPPFFANLLVVDPDDASQEGAIAADQLRRLVRPHGGTLCVGRLATEGMSRDQVETSISWLKQHFVDGFELESRENDKVMWVTVRRKPLEQAGEWTHGFADPSNSACSQDQLVKGPLRVQWYGRPGPRPMADRHHRAVPPLAKDGRLFVPGENQVIVVDAYNGAPLWRREISNSLRLGAFLDCSNMVVDDRTLFVAAEDQCHELDVVTGDTRRINQAPQLIPNNRRHWGYVARADNLLVGSARKPDASYYRQSRDADLALWYDDMSLVTSDYLFAQDVDSGDTKWTYQSGIIINTTLTIGGGRIYFLESNSPDALANERGRMPMTSFFAGPNFLVALDLATGQQMWKIPVDMSDARHIAYLNYADEKLIFSGNRYVDSRLWYFFSCLDATSGGRLWQASHNSEYKRGGDHGEQNRHPTIVGDVVYTYPYAYRLGTGERLADWKFDRMGHGCGNVSASANTIFWRGGNPWQCDLKDRLEPQAVNGVTRPGCFINMIPAGGLLLVPEASSGCTCGFPLQTSLAYVPAGLVE
jgi:outer membrane protein assembly factor BamB